MPKRKRGGRNGATPASAPADAGSGDGDVTTEGGVGDGLSGTVGLALRAVRWLTSSPADEAAEAHEALLEAARPLILLRAAKYEEDAKSVKATEAACGNPANARAGVGICKRHPNAATHGGEIAGTGAADAFQGPLLGQAATALRALAEQPALLAAKDCKSLRGALHPLVEAHLREERASPAFRITSKLSQPARWPEARLLLRELRAIEVTRRPKLGAYQRWVRELDVAAGTPPQLVMLDAIMRVAAGLEQPSDLLAAPAEGRLQWFEPFTPDASPPAPEQPAQVEAKLEARPLADSTQVTDAVSSEAPGGEERHVSVAEKLSALIAARRGGEAAAPLGPAAPVETSVVPDAKPLDVAQWAKGVTRLEKWTLLAHEAAHNRKPPNHYDLDIYESPDLCFGAPPAHPVARHALPGVPGAAVLSDVLSPSECESLRRLSEAIGYRPDVPLSSNLDERAQNVVLCASEVQNKTLFQRVRASLPQEFGGDKLLGLNRRWRLYRYQAGNCYRKHLDGAWPASTVRIGHGGRRQYVYDGHGGGTRSRLTFIVYLNEDFDGGTTTFFVPQPGAEGVLEARPVQPKVGFASVFPHGDTGVPLLHEGSPVTRAAKYLLRTDVVYAAPEDPEKLQEAKKRKGLVRMLGGEAKLPDLAETVEVTKGRNLGKKRTAKTGRPRRNNKEGSSKAGRKVRGAMGKDAAAPAANGKANGVRRVKKVGKKSGSGAKGARSTT